MHKFKTHKWIRFRIFWWVVYRCTQTFTPHSKVVCHGRRSRKIASPLGYIGKLKPQPGLVASDPSVLVLLLPLSALKTFLASLFDRGA
jgi:uncharacterized protein YggT (Ycf19 family)